VVMPEHVHLLVSEPDDAMDSVPAKLSSGKTAQLGLRFVVPIYDNVDSVKVG
jgi:REP element-mobilizing transposase RayT